MFRRMIVLLGAFLLSGAAANALPSISSLSASATAELYEKFEATFDVATVATNYYWPYDPNPPANTPDHPNAVPAGVGVSVDGLFLPPGESNWSNAVVQPGFYCQEYLTDPNNPGRNLTNGRSWMYPASLPAWKVLYAPTKLGEWKFKIKVTDADGTAESQEYSFICTGSENRGFVRVSSSDSRYFETSDGKYLSLVGLGGFQTNIAQMDSDYAKMRDMGITLLRPWWQGSWGPTALFGASGQGGDSYWNNLTYSTDYVRDGHLVSAKLPTNNKLWATVPVKPSTSYRMTAIVKTVVLAGTGAYGVYLDSGQATTSNPSLHGDNDWTTISYDFTTNSTYYELTWAGIGTKNITNGSAYVSEISVRENLGGGNYGCELFARSDFQAHTSFSQHVAATLDRQVELAKQYGIYLRVVVEEKQDGFYGRIQPDGTWGAKSDNNVYAWSSHACRTYQRYYWRYLISRYGYSTAIHSLELVNEGDPYNGNHSSAVEAFGQYVRANDPNKHLVSTSNWHSFPPQMWTQSHVDCTDLHMYIGWGVASGGNRIWPGWDGEWPVANSNTAPGERFAFDNSTAKSGSWSLKIAQPEAGTITGGSGYEGSALAFQVGALPGHTLRFTMWAKSENIGNQASGRPQLYMNYQATGSDWVAFAVPGGQFQVPTGTSDWQQVTAVSVVPTNARVLVVKPRTGNSVDGTGGTAWVDDVVIEDVTDHRILNFNGGFEFQEPESYDVVAGHSAYSQLTHSFAYGKPTIRGETALTYPQRFTNPYKGFNFTGEDQLLVDDMQGVWWKKWTWAHIHPGGLIEVYWFTDVLMSRKFLYGKAYQNFMAGIPLTNGHYQDVAATVSNPRLRVLGQKDLTNNKAHLWIDNSSHTWKNVVDGVTIPPVSGTVTITGLRDGPYQAEWWDTLTGVVTSTEAVECVSGKINLPISGLATDKACKIFQGDATPPSGSVNINGGATYATSSPVTLALSATDAESGVPTMRFSNDGSNWSTWESFAASKPWSLSPGDGIRTVYVQYMNGDGTPSLVYYDSIISDTVQPSGTMIINSGIACTGSANVLLTMTATDATSGVSGMRFSNNGSAWTSWEEYGTSKAWTLTAGDGAKTVYAQYKDCADNLSNICTGNITVDTTPPTGSIVINGGSAYATSISATLTLSATDAACDVSGMRFSNNGSAWTSWEEYGTSKAWTLTAGDGAKTVYVQYKDCAGTLSNICTGNITVDTTPPACSIVINGGDAQTNTASVTLTLSATDAGSGVSRMRFSNDASAWTTWESYANSRSWTLVSGDGAKTVYVQYDDVAGNVSTSHSDSIELIATAPTTSVTINDGDAYTNSTSVTLTLSDGGASAVEMRFSGDDITWSSWEAYAARKPWSLSSGNGDRAVYAEFRNGDGTISSPCSDTIVLDTSQPTGYININSGAQYANSANVTVTASVSDTGSGLGQMRFSNDGNAWSAWQAYAASKSWALASGSGSRTVYAQFRDGVGNTSSSLSDTITLDTVQPTGSVNINSGATYATSTSITLSLSASDSGSGVAQMRFSNDGATWSSWESYGTSKPWTLTAGDGTKTVCAQYKDGAGNTSQNCTDAIVLTNSGPTGTITINGGAEYVKTTSVTLALSASGGPNRVTQMRFSNDETTWSAWESFAASKSWSLSSEDGTKTVYAQFKDEAGRVSPSCSDTIIVKTVGPSLSITSPTSDSDYTTNHPALAISGTASSDVVSLVWATNSGDTGECIGTTVWVTDEIALTEGANTVTITAMDEAGATAAMSLTLDRVNVHPPDTWAGAMMVSIPIIPDEPDPKTAVGFDGNGWCIFRPTQNNYVVYENDPEQLTWFIPAASTPGRGFWAWFSGTVKTPLGSIPRQDQPATIHLYRGWNIIGNPFVSPVQWDVKQITVRDVGGSQNTLQNSRNVVDDFAYGWRHSGGAGTYYIVYDSSLWPGVDDTLRPWMAYWIRAYRECDLVIPAPPYDP